MLKKTLWILLPIALLLCMQVWAGESEFNPTTADYSKVKNPQAGIIPNPGIDEVDSTIYFEDFESGQGDWTFVDVTAAGNKWHTDDYNGYNNTDSWWCADEGIMGYDNHWLQYLISPSLDLGTASNPVLTFKMFYAIEDSAGTTAPYDGWDGANVWASVNGGATWLVLTPTFPAYTCQSLYSFGDEWGMGPNIPGWAGMSGGWVDVEFDISAAAGQSDFMFRIAFCSDPAECTVSNPSIFGYFVDEVSVDDGLTNIMYNDADGTATPSDFTFDQGGTSGDFWTLTTQSSHSTSHSMLCDHAGHYMLSDALVSPWLDIPPNMNVKFQFWLWCNMLDWDGDGDNILEDYYHVEVSTDNVVWNAVFYDYGDIDRPGGAAVGWDHYEPGDPFNGNLQMSLSQYGGQQIKLRFRVITDANDDGGIGDGLYIDDFEIMITGLDNDAAAQNMIVPMPTSAYFDHIGCSVELHNLGNLDLLAVPASWRVNQGVNQPLIPWSAIPVLSFVLKEWDWTTPNPGSYYMDAFTHYGMDENLMNDTTTAGIVEVTTADVLEFGYDGREYSYEAPLFQFNYETGEGTYIRYTPEDDGVDFNMDATELKCLFGDAGQIRIHILEPSTATMYGAEVTSWLADVTQVNPAWQTFDISGIQYLQDTRTDFWVWYEVLNDLGTPHLLGWDQISQQAEGHFFNDFIPHVRSQVDQTFCYYG